MHQHFDIYGDYLADNPFLDKQPLKHRFMQNAFCLYKGGRMFISRWVPLKDWQKYTWADTESLFSQRPQNAAVKCIYDGETPDFDVEYLFILELIPKESLNKTLSGIERFRFKHATNTSLGSHSEHMNWLKAFSDGEAFMHLDSLAIKQSSTLYQYISQINFHAINLTSSFFCLRITVDLNKELKSRLSKYAVTHIPEQTKITGFGHRRWYQFRYLGNGEFSGSDYKRQTIENVMIDIVWKTAKEIHHFVPSMCFTSRTLCPPYMCSIKTNIDGNTNEEFWRSVGVDSRFCDFTPDLTSCIAWRNDGEPFYLFSVPRKDTEVKIKNGIEAYHIADKLCDYLLFNKASRSIREILAQYSEKIDSKKRKLKHWLKLKVRLDTETYFFVRFLSEIDYSSSNVDDADESYITLRASSKTIISSIYSSLAKSIQKTNSLYKGINELFQANIDYKNAKNNYTMQNRALGLSMLSILIAIVAIIITVLTNDAAINKLVEWWLKIKNIFL